jgi:4-amino-4-deoxy-L-arabinose transferase-like glycosyltransferase
VRRAKLGAVDSAEAPAPGLTKTSLVTRIAWVTLIVVTLGVCYFSHLGAIGFVGPDEPRYAWIAREMAETGDWVTPRLYGKPWFEKPPLYYWSAALSFKLFGVSETAARLPSALAALLATLALAWLAWRVYGAETARWLLLLLPTSVAMIGFSHAASTDMLFSATLTLALVAAAAVLRLIPNGPFALSASYTFATLSPSLLFGFFLGLAVLAKGPAAIILLGGAVFLWAFFTKRWRDAFRLLHPAALAAFAITTFPWYVLCARINPGFFRIFIIEHNFKRYLTPEFQHVQPFWYYGVVLLIALLPWTALFLWASVTGAIQLWRTRSVSALPCFLLCWSVFCILFFTVSKSKLPGYILPAIPAIAPLVTRFLVRRLPEKGLPNSLLLSGGGLTLLMLAFVAARFGPRAPFVTDVRLAPSIAIFEVVMAAGGLMAVALALFRFRKASLAVVVTSVLLWPILGTGDLSELDLGVSARRMVIGAADHLTAEQLASAATYKLRRDFKYQVDFYLHREVSEWMPRSSKRSIIFTQRRYVEELSRLGVHCPQYMAYPAVCVCEDSKGGEWLLASTSRGQAQ